MKRNIFAAVLMFAFASFVFSQTGEQAPIVERDFSYNDWFYKDIATDRDVNLRKATSGKKLVMIAYFSPWCPNWKNNVAFVQKMYDKYRASGFEVIGVGEYATVGEMKTHAEQHKLTFPIVWESDSREARETTTHARMRRAAGDTRRWGSPWYVFLEAAKIEPVGSLFARRLPVVNGELIEAEAEKFIRTRLGLEKTAAVEACDEAKPTTVALVKP
jgi:hypothetical protein